MTLTLTKFETTFVVTWADGCSRETAVEFIENTAGSPESIFVCSVSTQYHAVHIIASNGNASFVPMAFSDNQWRPLFYHQWKLESFDIGCFKSEEAFRKVLERQMLLQFPKHITTYYEDFPSAQQVLDAIGSCATVKDLQSMRFAVYAASVQDDPEWDGAVSVMCEGGCVLVPYAGEDKQLIGRYATYSPESVTSALVNKTAGLLDKVSQFIGNIHWSNFRRHIENFGR